MVVLHLRTVPSSAARCFASADFASLCVLEASAASRPPMKAELPCLLGLLRPASATGGGLRAPPYQFPLKSYGFSGAETARKRFLLWKMGFSDAAHCTPMHPLNSAWSFHCARKLACGTPCFIGLTSACFAHCARPSCAPAVHAAGDDFNAKGFRLSRALLEFLTVCGTVKEQPKFLHSRKMPSGLQAEFPLPPPL